MPSIISVLTNVKWKPREVWSLDQSRPAGERGGGDSNLTRNDFLSHVDVPARTASRRVERENMSASPTSRSPFLLFLLSLWLLS